MKMEVSGLMDRHTGRGRGLGDIGATERVTDYRK